MTMHIVLEKINEIEVKNFFGIIDTKIDSGDLVTLKQLRKDIANNQVTLYDKKEFCLQSVKIIKVVNHNRILVENKQLERFWTTINELI